MAARRPPAEDPDEQIRRAERELRLAAIEHAGRFLRHVFSAQGNNEVRLTVTKHVLSQAIKASESEAAASEQGEMREAMRRVEEALRPPKKA